MSTISFHAASTLAPRIADEARQIAFIQAGTYLNKINGEQLERSCLRHLNEGCRALVINFKDTDFVNSIGVANLLGVIDAAEAKSASVVFCHVTGQTAELFELLGLTQLVALATDEEEARALLQREASSRNPEFRIQNSE